MFYCYFTYLLWKHFNILSITILIYSRSLGYLSQVLGSPNNVRYGFHEKYSNVFLALTIWKISLTNVCLSILLYVTSLLFFFFLPYLLAFFFLLHVSYITISLIWMVLLQGICRNVWECFCLFKIGDCHWPPVDRQSCCWTSYIILDSLSFLRTWSRPEHNSAKTAVVLKLRHYDICDICIDK